MRAKLFRRDESVYKEASIFDAWLKNADERDRFSKFFEEKLDVWATKSPLSIIDIGCGSGASGMRIMEILGNASINYKYTGIEPFEDQLKYFKDKLNNKKNIQFKVSTLEDFQTNDRFDMAFVVHSLYYVPDMLEAVKKIHSFSERAAIVHQGYRGINEIHERFRNYMKKGPHLISTCDDIARCLDNAGIDFELHSFESKVNVSSIKENGNETGRKLIQFFLERTDLSDDIIEEIRDYFRKGPDIIIQDEGFFITKNKRIS
ncbi:MAG: class I SAM-dependent methyltransferase [Prolixibacteraceae bacterium]|nr:class I SAM-dependent methyltransferase [Prolixibacteraceae bacterium]